MEYHNTYGDLSDKDFQRIGSFIYENYGINLYPHKKTLLKSRLIKRVKHLGLSSYSEYSEYLFNHEEEVIYMIDNISTNKTDFFREPSHFDFLKDHLKNVFAEKSNTDLLIWSAGCSSGQEAYSLAMMIEDLRPSNLNFSIYGSDISLSVLKTAKQAIYPFDLLDQIPPLYRKKYLLKSKEVTNPRFRISKELRSKIHFSFYNLLSNESFSDLKFDIIFCRNTLIYFDNETQKAVINNLINHLSNNGLLFLGHSESIINMNLKLDAVHPSVYKKNNHE